MGRIHCRRMICVGAVAGIILTVLRVITHSPYTVRLSSKYREQSFYQENVNEVFPPGIKVLREKMDEFRKKDFNIVTQKLSELIPEEFLRKNECPICFGTEICDAIRRGALQVDLSQPMRWSLPEKEHKIVYKGNWKSGEAVMVKTVPRSDFVRFRSSICNHIGYGSHCSISNTTVWEAFVGNHEQALTVTSINNAYKIVKKSRADIPLALCANTKLLSHIVRAFDEDGNGILNPIEGSVLFTTMGIFLEALALRLLTKINPTLPFLQYYGSCGQLIVIESGTTPLSDFLQEPFPIRASLAAQILQMVDDFTNDEDSEWLVILIDFSYENLGVNRDGEVVILDIEDIVFIEKHSVHMEDTPIIVKGPCNEECIRRLSHLVRDANSTNVCSSLMNYSHIMYAVVCQKILSFLDEHHSSLFFDIDQEGTRNLNHLGLLHDPPNKDRQSLEELLQECVQETSAGGRLQAAEELRDYLSTFLDEDEDNGEVEGEDDTDDDYQPEIVKPVI